jgi:hypothetical protein
LVRIAVFTFDRWIYCDFLPPVLLH